MRRKKFAVALFFGIGLALAAAVFVLNETRSLAKDEKRVFDFRNIEAPKLIKAESVPQGAPNQAKPAPPAKKEEVNLTRLIAQFTVSLRSSPAVDSSLIENIARLLAEEIQPKSIDMADIKFSLDNSKEAKAIYQNIKDEIDASLHQSPADQPIINTVHEFIKTRDPQTLKQTKEIYSQGLKDYLNLEAPFDYAETHARTADFLNKIVWSLELVEKYPEDPARALLALEVLSRLQTEIQ